MHFQSKAPPKSDLISFDHLRISTFTSRGEAIASVSSDQPCGAAQRSPAPMPRLEAGDLREGAAVQARETRLHVLDPTEGTLQTGGEERTAVRRAKPKRSGRLGRRGGDQVGGKSPGTGRKRSRKELLSNWFWCFRGKVEKIGSSSECEPGPHFTLAIVLSKPPEGLRSAMSAMHAMPFGFCLWGDLNSGSPRISPLALAEPTPRTEDRSEVSRKTGVVSHCPLKREKEETRGTAYPGRGR